MGDERFFTIDEANALLPDLRDRLQRIKAARQTVLDHATPVRDRAEMNGGGKQGAELFDAMRTLRDEVQRLSEEGIVLRDADSGLIDFPSQKEGRLIYLCWTPDEDRIGFWHEVDTGFGGRKPL